MPKGLKGFQKGHTVNKGRKHTEESVKNIVKSKIGEKNPMWNGGKRERKCIKCKKIFYRHKIRKYCSNICSNTCKKRLKKLSEAKEGKLNEKGGNWRGDEVGYMGVHIWISKMKGKAKLKKCLFCPKQAKNWANKKHDYKRKINDYISLCCSCHKKYDIKNNGKRKNNKAI